MKTFQQRPQLIKSHSVYGIAFKIKSSQKLDTYKKLAFRERAGYQIKIQNFRSLTGDSEFSVAMFLGEKDCDLSKKGESQGRTVKNISGGQPPKNLFQGGQTPKKPQKN